MESLLTLADGGIQRRILLDFMRIYFNKQNTYMGQHLKGTKGYLNCKIKSLLSLSPKNPVPLLGSDFLNSLFFQGYFMNTHANIFTYTHIHICVYLVTYLYRYS